MAKTTFIITTTKTVSFDAGSVPTGLLKVLLEAGNDGYSLGDTDWSIGDMNDVAESAITTVEVVKGVK